MNWKAALFGAGGAVLGGLLGAWYMTSGRKRKHPDQTPVVIGAAVGAIAGAAITPAAAPTTAAVTTGS